MVIGRGSICWAKRGEQTRQTAPVLVIQSDPFNASLLSTPLPQLFVTIRWESNFAAFRDRGIPLIHQVTVPGPSRRPGVATLLMDAAEDWPAAGA